MSRRSRSSLLLASLIGILTPIAAPVAALAAVSPTDDADAIAHAIMASAPQLTGATWQQRPLNIASSATATDFGTQPASAAFPSDGDTFAILSSGNAAVAGSANNGWVSGSGWGADRGDSHDISELRLDINVPSRANCLSLDFSFLSEEFPDYVGEYNDAFIAELDTSDWTSSGTNVSAPHDFALAGGDVVSINSHGLATVDAADAAGTTYNGATPRLSASTPITPGPHRVYLSISDNGDWSLDSAAFVDNLQLGFVANPSRNCEAGVRSAPPHFELNGPASATGPEGSILRTSGRFDDPDTTALSLAISPNPGTFVDNGDGTWSWSLFAADDMRLGGVTVSATSGLGFTDSASFDAVATNVAPTVRLSSGNDTDVDEGADEHAYSYSISDPGTDTIPSVVTSCGPGLKVAGSDAHTDAGGSFRCVFADGPAAALVTAQATDDDGGVSTPASQLVTVHNVAPTVSFGGSGRLILGEGATERTFTYSIGDPGRDTIVSVATDCGDGGRTVAGSSRHTSTDGSFACVFADGPATPTVSAAARDSDRDAGAAASRDVLVRDIAPTLALDEGNRTSIDEGAAEVAFHYWTEDPGDDTVSVDTSCGMQGTKVAGSDAAGRFACVFPDGDATSTVSATPTDSDGVSGFGDAQLVSIHDVAPRVTLQGGDGRRVDEGPAPRTFDYAITDPGRDTITAVATSCGDAGRKVPGSDAHGDAEGSLGCVFADGPASGAVTVSATDSDALTGATAAQAVTVDDVAPTVTLAADNPLAVDESSRERGYRYAITDPGIDTIASVATSCGAAAEKVPDSDRFEGLDGRYRCVFARGPAASRLSVKATDSDGLSGLEEHQTVTVHDPEISADGAAIRGIETVEITGRVARFSDPTPYATAQEYAASIDWGDATARSEGAIRKTGDGQFAVAGTHAYARVGTYSVTVRIGDVDNSANAATASSSATIADAPIHATGRSATTPTAFSAVIATLTDEATPAPAAAEFSATIDWGDGTPRSVGTASGPDASGRYGVRASHAYAATGRYAATVVVSSAGGSSDRTTSSLLVYAFATSSGGSFAISDAKALPGAQATFWGANWRAANPFVHSVSYTGAFKGFVDPPATMTSPRCGDTWAARTGGSGAPPLTTPAFMAVVVASKMEKTGSTIAGDVAKVVVVKTDPGYANDAGHAGTGKVVAQVCG